jgi:HEAT repeat protein
MALESWDEVTAERLAAELEAGDWNTRREIIERIGRCRLARFSARAINLVQAQLDHKECHVRRTAIAALVRLSGGREVEAGAETAPAADIDYALGAAAKAAQRLLEDEDWGVQRMALDALGGVVPRGDEVVLSLVYAHIADEDDDVRGAVARATSKLAAIGDDEAVARVASLFEDIDEGVREKAVLAFSELALPGDKAAIAKVKLMLRDEEEDVRKAANQAFARLMRPEGC